MNREELDQIITDNQLWNESNGKIGKRADLRKADLRGANLQGANLQEANLQEANLRKANLREANLREANLWGAVGNSKEMKSLFIECYDIVYTSEILQIGCENHKICEWKEFSDNDVLKMDGKSGLEWFLKWKDIIFKIIEMSPAVPGRG